MSLILAAALWVVDSTPDVAFTNAGTKAHVRTHKIAHAGQTQGSAHGAHGEAAGINRAAAGPVYEVGYDLACGSATGQDNCTYALSICEYRGETGPLYYRKIRPAGSAPDTPWTRTGETCLGSHPEPPGTQVTLPPPVPTFAQIQQAFRALPFAKPTVKIQPEGTTTLVNLPTYYRTEWPTTHLGPGDTSNPVQLLTWSIQFKIDPATYTYTYGDGTTEGPTTSTGGTYPTGDLTHTYTRAGTATIHTDAQLTGTYRINGQGPWEPINTTADLQDEPTTTITIKEAHNALTTD